MYENYDTKDYRGEIKDLDLKNRIVTGYLSSWDLDSYKDQIQPGAFRKTLAERKDKILFLNQHSWKEPHGFFNELAEDQKGLRFVSNSLPNTSFSNDAMELYARGIVKEHSIGFRTIKSTYDQETEIRTITEIKLFEGSNVTLGANSNTPFTGFKSLSPAEIEDMSKKIMDTLRNGTLTDQTFLQLEIALKQLQRESYLLGKSDNTVEGNQPPEGTDPQSTVKASDQIYLFTQNL